MPRRLPLTLLLLTALCGLPDVCAEGVWKPGLYRLSLDGHIRAVRHLDLDGDKRLDLVVLTEPEPGTSGVELLYLLRTPAQATPRSLFPEDHITRIELDGVLGDAGALAVGRFGPDGAGALRFLGPRGVTQMDGAGATAPTAPRLATATLLGRSPGRRIVFWDGVADLDGDERDELFFPLGAGEGRYRLLGGKTEQDRTLTLDARSTATFDSEHQIARHARIPRLLPRDMDGDGNQELVTLRDRALLVFDVSRPQADALAPSARIPLAFLEPPKDLPPATLHTPRVQLEDVDGDGTTDLLVTLISGRRDRIGSLRTTLFHYPGPIVDPKTGSLVAPRARIDTESVALHPTFVDLDGDGARDYVGDSIRGKDLLEVLPRLVGEDPDIHYVGFRFDRSTGTFAGTPWFTTKRVYPSAEALGNRFGRSARFEGDFNGDGLHDLLDLGNLGSVGVQRGTRRDKGEAGDPLHFDTALLPAVPVKEGLRPDALVVDLDGNQLADAVLWSRDALYVLLSRKAGR